MIKNTAIKNILSKSVFRVVSLLNSVCAKDDKVVLLYCNMEFRDNIKYLYEYMIEKGYQNKYRIIVSTPEAWKGPFEANVQYISNIRAIKAFLKAGHVIYSFGKLPIYPSRGQTVIQTWHGTPFKGFDETMQKNGAKKTYYTYALASSEYIKPVVAKLFSVSEDHVAICGQPRTDVMYEANKPCQLGVEGTKQIFWAPTFRKSQSLGYNDTAGKSSLIPLFENEQLTDLDAELRKRDVGLIIKLHPSQDLDGFHDMRFTHIRLLTHEQFVKEGYDIYRLLPQTDALITDYSSIFFDYMLLDKPMAFTLDDYDDYSSRRGFAVKDPMSLMAGHKIRTSQDFLTFVQDIAQDKDLYSEQRRHVNQMINRYQDGKNRERALRLAGIEYER